VQDATQLATLTVTVRAELLGVVDGLIKQHLGEARCPAKVGPDGSRVYVFRAEGHLFASVCTSVGYDGSVRVDAGPGFIALNGEWVDGTDLLDVRRAELAPMDLVGAQALIAKLDKLLEAHTAPPPQIPRYVPRPLLEPGQRLLWSNTRALDAMRRNGFAGLVPVRWGEKSAERDGYSDAVGNFHYNVRISEHGVGVELKAAGLVALQPVTATFRDDVDEAIRSLGPYMVVRAGEQQATYLLRTRGGAAEEMVHSPATSITVKRRGLIVLSGAVDGHEVQMSPDLLTVKVQELASFEAWETENLRRALESLPPITEYKAPKRKKSA
jgi:hypothetical protein